MTSFGEIVEPDSRTAWEDWDDDTASQQEISTLNWQKNIAVPDAIETFVILEGKYFYDCIKQIKSKLYLVDSIKDVSLCLFKAEAGSRYVCIVKNYNLLQSSEIVELIKPYIAVSCNVISVQSKPLAEYQAYEIDNLNCVMRMVSTTKQSDTDIVFKKLEQPNIISGVSAGVISLREHLNQPGIAVVCYIEYHEEYQIEEVQTLLKQLKIISKVKSGATNILDSNLYI